MTDAMLFRWTMRPRLKRQSFYGSNPTFINLWNETHFSCLISQRSATVSLSRKNAKLSRTSLLKLFFKRRCQCMKHKQA